MYIPEDIRKSEDFQACISFHGHTCMGVTIGYMAAKLAMKELAESRAEDEEMIAIVETDACCCDAIQVLTGCTFGKGNFFFKDHGKMAFTFGSRTTGKGIRLVLKNEIFTVPEKEQYLADRIREGVAPTEEIKEYEMLYEERGKRLFAQGPEAFFSIQKNAAMALPPSARMAPSKPCSICKELVMETKLKTVGTKQICRACLD